MFQVDLGFIDEENVVYTLVIDGIGAMAFEELCRASSIVQGFERSDEAEFRFRVDDTLYVWDGAAGEVELSVSSSDVTALGRSLRSFITLVKTRADRTVFRFYFGSHYEQEIGRA